MTRKHGGVGPGGIGCAVVCLLLWIFVLVRVGDRPEGPKYIDPYRKGVLDQQVYTAEVDQRKADRLLSQGKREEGEEYLSRAEEKLYRGQQEKADGSFLSQVQSGVATVKSQHAGEINPIRKRRAQERLRRKAEGTRLALKLLQARADELRAGTFAQEFRDDAWDELIKIAQLRIGRQTPGSESYLEDPFRVDPTLLRQALYRKRGARYIKDMDSYSPGACEAVSKEAEDLANAP